MVHIVCRLTCVLHFSFLYSTVISQVGACIVLKEPRRAISVGYNGLPNGRGTHSISDNPEDYGMIV